MKRFRYPLSFALSCVCCVSPALACERMALAFPMHLQTVADLQPTLSWHGEPDARYRMQVAAVLPEARVLALYDVEVAGTHWRLPEPLAVPRAGIKVLVSRNCQGLDTQDLLARGPAFFVDVRPGCAIDPQSFVATASALQWAGVAGAQRYSVRTFVVPGGEGDEALRLNTEQEVHEPRWLLNAGTTRPRVLSIQPVCNGLAGRPAAWLLP